MDLNCKRLWVQVFFKQLRTSRNPRSGLLYGGENVTKCISDKTSAGFASLDFPYDSVVCRS